MKMRYLALPMLAVMALAMLVGSASADTVTSTATVVDVTALNTAISSANTISSAAVVGTASGDYPSGALSTLNSAISDANTFETAIPTSSDVQTDVDSAATTLSSAIAAFEASVILPVCTMSTSAASFGFGTIIAGTPSSPQTISVTNTGNVNTATISIIGSEWMNGATDAGTSSVAWTAVTGGSATSAQLGSSELNLGTLGMGGIMPLSFVLTIPAGTIPATYTETITPTISC